MERPLVYLLVLLSGLFVMKETYAQTGDATLKIPLKGQEAIFVNGKRADTLYVNPAGIKSLTILKGDKLTAPYGIKGESVLLIETTEDNIPRTVEAATYRPGFSFSEPLLYINGRKSDRALATIRPDKIETMTLLKGDNTLPYGAEGKNGVILIETKK